MVKQTMKFYKPIPKKGISVTNPHPKLTPTQDKWAKSLYKTSKKWTDRK
jgi:hypothetical protein